MIGAIGALTVESTVVSPADAARLAAEEALHAEWQRRTVRVIASSARDVEDCRLLLDMLGLDRPIIAAARAERPARPVRRRSRAA